MAAQTLAQLLATLPEEERIILTLHYLRNLSSGQIAQMLHVPEAAVLGVISSGRARLTSALEN
ncbi:MAG: sigma-70 family RNA polymerase sigma factor [Streptomycetaceae bacterium]|jgi:DNA-directed RNA polymerase specialized sigma24 family protein|nr:MAG: sigma-70 family RNA polymerase sigma factor [Streptomycetaceae bacterium]